MATNARSAHHTQNLFLPPQKPPFEAVLFSALRLRTAQFIPPPSALNRIIICFYPAGFSLSGNRSWRLCMHEREALYSWALFFLSVLTTGAASPSPGTNLMPVPRANLCVTEGAIEELPAGRLSVTVPKMRAYLNAVTPPFVEAHFTYLGATGNEARLGSGELRRQFGLKLRAQDACNLVYAMWRIEPESKLVVSVKSNPGQHTSAECGNNGYRNIKPRHSIPVPGLRSGRTHTLRAEMNGAEMLVFVDNSLVWEGSVGPDALAFDGPVGIRSDNLRLQIELRAGQPLQAQSGHGPGCLSSGEESE